MLSALRLEHHDVGLKTMRRQLHACVVKHTVQGHCLSQRSIPRRDGDCSLRKHQHRQHSLTSCLTGGRPIKTILQADPVLPSSSCQATTMTQTQQLVWHTYGAWLPAQLGGGLGRTPLHSGAPPAPLHSSGSCAGGPPAPAARVHLYERCRPAGHLWAGLRLQETGLAQ